MLQRKFPFDVQSCFVTIESIVWSQTDLQFQLCNPTALSVTPANNPYFVDGWISNAANDLFAIYFKNYNDTAASFAAFSTGVTLFRIPDFYLNRFVVQGSFLVWFSILSLLLPVFGSQGRSHPMGVLSVSAFLGGIQLLFTASTTLPVLPYSTALDIFSIVNACISFSCFLYNFVVSVDVWVKIACKSSKKTNKGRCYLCWVPRASPIASGVQQPNGTKMSNGKAIEVASATAAASAAAASSSEASPPPLPYTPKRLLFTLPHSCIWAVFQERTVAADLIAFSVASLAFVANAGVLYSDRVDDPLHTVVEKPILGTAVPWFG